MKNVCIAAWIPDSRYQQNRDEGEPQFVVCSTRDLCLAEVVRWIFSSKDNYALMSDANLANFLLAAKEEDWETVIELYNDESRDAWYIEVKEVGVDDGDPEQIDIASIVAEASA